MVTHFVVSALFAYTVLYGAVIVTLSFHSGDIGGMSAYRRMPVTYFVPLPNVRIESMVGTAHVVSADVAFAIVVAESVNFVFVSFIINGRNVMSAYRSMPVTCFVSCPCITFCITMLVTVIPGANITDTVVVDVGMGTLVLGVYRVSAGRLIPVLGIVNGPFFLIGVYVVVVPSAVIAKSVAVSVQMLGETLLNTVSAGGSIPVVSQVVGVIFLIGVSVVVVPRTNVANAVVIEVGVLSLVLRFYITVAGVAEKVMSLVVGIFFLVFVGTECIIADFNIAFTVVVKVLVTAFYLSVALVALKVFILVLVRCAFNSFVAFITLKVTVVIEMSCATALDCKSENVYFGDIYSGNCQACARNQE